MLGYDERGRNWVAVDEEVRRVPVKFLREGKDGRVLFMQGKVSWERKKIMDE